MHRTLAKPVEFTGTGLHGGQTVSMVVRPADAGHGIVFQRTDLAEISGLTFCLDLYPDRRELGKP